ncbi:Mu-like prophage major head subunit gpT family protein [Bradyrhizobium ontarionense]|uniref:Mu-like prophage major head subunit gpT family protein n=1 Tax=Bradyrhizobium ontarionense TaxID=2898149 RepID=A0ABY3RE04_9BRAD|nr:Mu-like prophage major head subunit gpT family protein [Bradyrhizobium sp. A19]UFZ05464.1 Mu-like prophage major head subunit gpT family protein [Bradyrhizobium sp. A19]
MLINRQNLDGLRVGFKTTFQNQLQQTATLYQRVSTVVPSTTQSEAYGWLGKIPSVREWLGERVVQNLSEWNYAIKNKTFELTIGVDREHIEDDILGMYTPIFQSFGESVAAWPDQLVWPLLNAGFTTNCYDGQFFFDTDHPVIAADGVTVNQVANTDGGSGTPWFLLDVSRVIKPIIWQLRKKGDFIALDRPDDPNVFNKKEFQYGWDGRGNAGYGLWQFAWGSKQTLNKANYALAKQSLMGLKGDHGRPLGIFQSGKPLLVYPSSLDGAAKALINAQQDSSGASNIYYNDADLLCSTWLG